MHLRCLPRCNAAWLLYAHYRTAHLPFSSAARLRPLLIRPDFNLSKLLENSSLTSTVATNPIWLASGAAAMAGGEQVFGRCCTGGSLTHAPPICLPSMYH